MPPTTLARMWRRYLALVVLVNGCGKSVSRSDASAYYTALEPEVDAVSADLTAALKEVHRFKTPPPECAGKSFPTTRKANECRVSAGDWHTAARDSDEKFRKGPMLDLFDKRPHLVGLELKYPLRNQKPTDPPAAQVSLGFAMGPNMKGAVEPEHGAQVSKGRAIGWGYGQTAIEFGDGTKIGSSDAKPMIKVRWDSPIDYRTVRVLASFLAEEPTDPAWRAGLRRARR